MNAKYFVFLISILLVTQLKSFAQEKTGIWVDSRDKQEYKWVKINDKIWMAENLNFKTDSDSWNFNNDSLNGNKYGRLYTFDMAKKVCPEGWHLPSKEDFEELIKFYGDEDKAVYAITKLDSLGLNIVLAGWRSYKGSFANYDDTGLWTSTENENDKELAYGLKVWGNQLFIENDVGKICGYYVRCIKNE